MKVKMMLCAMGILCLFLGVSVYASEVQGGSKGKVAGFVEIWTQDISYLHSEIKNLKSECGRE